MAPMFEVARGFATLLVVVRLGDAVRTNMDLAQNVVEIGKADSASANPALCAPELVAETCNLLSGEESELATAADVAEMLSASKVSVDAFWDALSLPPSPTCAELCDVVKDTIPKDHLPPASDLGCYSEGGEMKCDLCLTRECTYHATVFNGDLPDLHDEEIIDRAEAKLVKFIKKSGEPVTVEEHAKDLDYTVEKLTKRVANIFRIYPYVEVKTTEDHEALLEISAWEESMQNMTEDTEGCMRAKCWRADQCEEQRCMHCQMCLVKKPVKPDHPVLITCPEGQIPLRNGCTCDKANGWVFDYNKGYGCVRDVAPKPKPAFCYGPGEINCPYDVTKCCCKPGYDNRPGQGCVKHIARPTAASWQVEVQRRGQQAISYINTAIRQFKAKKTQRQVQKWFGFNSQYATKDTTRKRAEIQTVLNSVSAMLDNVEYKFPGRECAPNTFAYVYPHPPHNINSRGQYIFHLCKLYMDSDESVQVETLTHEGSHHATAYTNDVCMGEVYGRGKRATYIEKAKSDFGPDVQVGELYDMHPGPITIQVVTIIDNTVVLEVDPMFDCDPQHKAYGREPCEQLAEYDNWKAIRNADNFCYYVQDVTDH